MPNRAAAASERLELQPRRRRALRFEERLGARVGAARQVKPQRHLAVAECVRLALAEPQLALGDRLIAAAAFRAAARGGFDDVCHVRIIERGRRRGCPRRAPRLC